MLSDEVLLQLDATLEHFNGHHADTMLLLARFGAGCPDADDAEAIAVDAGGVDLAVRVGAADRIARLAFPAAASTLPEIQGHFLGQVDAARANAGDRIPLTSLERELANSGSLPTAIAEVVAVRDLTTNIREIVFEVDAFASVGGDQFVFVMVPRTGDGPIADDFTMADWMDADPETRAHGAYYTVRDWDPNTGYLTMWFVLHSHETGVGAWAACCQPAARVALWGPREGMGVRPDAASHLLIADESGFAAVAALLDELPDDAVGHVVVETVDADDVVELPHRADVEVTWVFRGDDQPGVVNRLLAEVMSLDLDPAVDRGCLVAFGAAESRQVTAIRKHLRDTVGLPARDVHMTGYWRM